MAYDATFPHFCQPFADQRVLVGVQLDVVGDRLVDRIAARTVLRGGQGIEGFDLFGQGAEADGFLGGTHNAKTIACIIVYYKTLSSSFWFRYCFSCCQMRRAKFSQSPTSGSGSVHRNRSWTVPGTGLRTDASVSNRPGYGPG